MNAVTETAACPLCAAPGDLARPCASAGCQRLGMHSIPPEHMPSPGAAADPRVGRMLGDYLVVRRLGAGGVGCVYLALQQPIGLPAAVKLLHGTPSALNTPERFRQEAAALARLSHPNIVRLLKYGVDGGESHLVMEYVEDGRTLQDDMRDGIAVPDARRVLRQMCHGLEAAHRRGVVHRDIKPANVMLQAVPGESHFVRLVDFGLAKFVDDGHETRLAAGTPQYMAPEQALKSDIGPWTDVYAVVVIACEMLLGGHPFPGGSAQAVLLRKCDPAFDPVAALDRPVGPAMAGLLRRGLAASPAERLRDTAALMAALDAAFDERGADGLLTASLGATVASASGGASWPVSGALSAPKRGGRRRAWAPWAVGAGVLTAGVALGAWMGGGRSGPAAGAASSAVTVLDPAAEAAGATPVDVMPVDAMPDDAMPGDPMLRDAMPSDAMPSDAMPDAAMPSDAMPDAAMPDPATAERGTSRRAPPRYAPPKSAAPARIAARATPRPVRRPPRPVAAAADAGPPLDGGPAQAASRRADAGAEPARSAESRLLEAGEAFLR